MRLLGGIFQNGQSLGTDGSQHDIDGGTDRNDIQVDVRTEHLLAGGIDKAKVGGDGGAQCLKALDVLVDRTDTEVAASRRRNVSFSKASQKGTEEIIGRTKMTRPLIRNHRFGDVACINFDSVFFKVAHLCAQIGQYLKQDGNITDVWYVFDDTDVLCKNSCRDDCNRSIFCSADLHLTVEGFSAVNYVFFQG